MLDAEYGTVGVILASLCHCRIHVLCSKIDGYHDALFRFQQCLPSTLVSYAEIRDKGQQSFARATWNEARWVRCTRTVRRLSFSLSFASLDMIWQVRYAESDVTNIVREGIKWEGTSGEESWPW